MANSVFQSVMVQLKDAADRVFGVIDADGYAIAQAMGAINAEALQQGIDLIARQFQFRKAFLDLLAADAGIDQDLCMVRANICTVTAASAGNGTEFQPQDDHLFSIK